MTRKPTVSASVRLSLAACLALAAFAPASAIAQAPNSPTQGQKPEVHRYVKAARVNVRSGPGTSHKPVDVVAHGLEVTIYLTQGDWSRISPSGRQERWIYTPLLQPSAPERSKSVPKANKSQLDELRKDLPSLKPDREQ